MLWNTNGRLKRGYSILALFPVLHYSYHHLQYKERIIHTANGNSYSYLHTTPGPCELILGLGLYWGQPTFSLCGSCVRLCRWSLPRCHLIVATNVPVCRCGSSCFLVRSVGGERRRWKWKITSVDSRTRSCVERKGKLFKLVKTDCH